MNEHWVCGGRLSQDSETGKLDAFNCAFLPAIPYPNIDVSVKFMLAVDPAETDSDGAAVNDAAFPVWVICNIGPRIDCSTVDVDPVKPRKFASPLYTG